MTHPPTDQQRHVIRAVHDLTCQRGYPPTFQEIADHVGFACHDAARWQVGQLIRLGLLDRAPHRARSVRLGPNTVVSTGGRLAYVAATFRRCQPCGIDVPATHECPHDQQAGAQ